MINNEPIEVFAGLIAIFLLYSLLASIIMEIIAKYIGLRARISLKSIAKLLDDSDFYDELYVKRIFKAGWHTKIFKPFSKRPFTALFYSHPNIKNLGRNDVDRKPSYISPEMFSNTLIQLLRGDNFKEGENSMEHIKTTIIKNNGLVALPEWYTSSKNKSKAKAIIESKDSPEVLSEAKSEILPEVESINVSTLQIDVLTTYQLKQILLDSGNDIDVFKTKLQNWFNEMMDRATGWYTKQTRGLLFCIGLLIAVSLNVDTLYIAHQLSIDEDLRQKGFLFAEVMLKDSPATQQTDYKNTNDTLVGVKSEKNVETQNKDTKQKVESLPKYNTNYKYLGWIMTAMAISLGAPFWFDLLGKIMNIAQAGKTFSTGSAKSKSGNKREETDEAVG